MTTIPEHDFDQNAPLRFDVENLEDVFRLHKEALLRPHRTEFYQIFWLRSGKIKHTVDFQSVELTPDTLLFIPKNSV